MSPRFGISLFISLGALCLGCSTPQGSYQSWEQARLQRCQQEALTEPQMEECESLARTPYEQTPAGSEAKASD